MNRVEPPVGEEAEAGQDPRPMPESPRDHRVLRLEASELLAVAEAKHGCTTLYDDIPRMEALLEPAHALLKRQGLRGGSQGTQRGNDLGLQGPKAPPLSSSFNYHIFARWRTISTIQDNTTASTILI